MYDDLLPRLIYDNPLSKTEDVKGFQMEGHAAVTFPQSRMRMENRIDPAEGQQSNYVFWCPKEIPVNFRASWEFYPIREPGLCMFFFAAAGRGGEDLFGPSLWARTGVYSEYHSGDINTYHLAYFRRRYPDEPPWHRSVVEPWRRGSNQKLFADLGKIPPKVNFLLVRDVRAAVLNHSRMHPIDVS